MLEQIILPYLGQEDVESQTKSNNQYREHHQYFDESLKDLQEHDHVDTDLKIIFDEIMIWKRDESTNLIKSPQKQQQIEPREKNRNRSSWKLNVAMTVKENW